MQLPTSPVDEPRDCLVRPRDLLAVAGQTVLVFDEGVAAVRAGLRLLAPLERVPQRHREGGRLRRGEKRVRVVEDLGVRRDARGHDRLAGGEVRVDLERRVLALDPR